VPSAKDDSGKPVDWWFMYKLPSGIGPEGKRKTKGNEYVYYDPNEKRPLHLSPHTLGTGRNGALYHTFQQLFSRPGPETGWIFYNDEYPDDMSPYDPAKKDPLQAAHIQERMIAKWKKGKGDWPPAVKPNIHSDKSRIKDRGHPVDHPHNGHCKGALAFDLATGTAFWLSHSTPKVPFLHEPASERFFYPEVTWKYAQTFICITLDSIQAACRIAKVMRTQHEPQIYGCRLPKEVTQTSKEWAPLWKLAQGVSPPAYGAEYAEKHGHRKPANIKFKSKAGKQFRLIAKSGAWYDDFWIDLVGPSLENYKGGKGVDLRVETWRRLTPTAMLPFADLAGDYKEEAVDFGSHDFTTTYKGHEYHHEFFEKDGRHVVDEATNVDLRMLKDNDGNPLTGYAWPYTKDHAKWAISEEDEERGVRTVALQDGTMLADMEGTVSDWVCVADINRMTSQERRGGGAICFHEPLLWHGLNEIERISGKIT